MVITKFLKIGLYNAGSLGTKHDELQMAIGTSLPDILAINETWLRAGEEGRAPTLTGYRLRHIPRPTGQRRERGGGVGFYVKQGINARTLLHPHSPVKVEQMWLSVNIKSLHLLVGTAYRPEWVNVDDFFDALTESFFSFGRYDHVILAGDFNIDWFDSNNIKNKRLQQFLHYTGLSNHVSEPTHFTSTSATSIDLVCSDAPLLQVNVDHHPELGGHAIVVTEFKIKRPKIHPKIISYRPIKNIDLKLFNIDLERTDWDGVAAMSDVNEMVVLFNTFIINLMDKHAPVKQIVVRDKPQPWFTDNVRHIMRLRDDAQSQYRNTNSDADKTQYKMLKHLARTSLFYEKTAFFGQQINSNLKNPKLLWKRLKNTVVPFKNRHELPAFLRDPDAVNEAFLDIPGGDGASISDLTYFEYHRHGSATFTLTTVHEHEVAKHILSIKSNATGVDSINMDMIIMTLPRTLSVITAIINKSIQSSTYPSLWKIAIIRPIPKNNHPASVKDLRPISILPYLSKILERVVHGQLIRYCEANGVLPLFQSGFRKQRSTTTALLDVVDNILASQDIGGGSILSLLDFSRAFDSINIPMLLSKMSYYGLDHSSICWFSSYLSERYQRVVMQNSDGTSIESGLRNIVKGVPQGSILGPLLFILYSSDLAECILNCRFHLYADDLQIYISGDVHDLSSMIGGLNDDLSRISAWCSSNGLILNATKSKYLILGSRSQVQKIMRADPQVVIGGVAIERVSSAKNLGVQMDSELRFENHILDVTRSCFYRLRVLYNFRSYISQDLRVLLCEALVLSRLNYCISVYSGCLKKSSQKLIQRVQNSCARYCFRIPPRTHITPYLNKFGILKMEARQKLYLACLMFDVLQTRKPEYLYQKIHWSRPVRGNTLRSVSNNVIDIPKHRTTAFRGGFRYRACKCWNNIPPPLRDIKHKMRFKREYKKHLLSEQICLSSHIYIS